jgi:hypothetical protein
MVHVDVNTLSVTHIFDGEEVVHGSSDFGESWVATFADAEVARLFVEIVRERRIYVKGDLNE